MSGPDIYAMLRQEPGTEVSAPGGSIQLVLMHAPDADWEARVRRWISRAIAAISAYLGHFPVSRTGLIIGAQPGRGIRGGVTFGFDSSAIKVDVGTETSNDDFDRDWVLTHEFVHLGFPDLRRRHLWLQEGSATYVEPIARIQAGQLSAETMWHDLGSGLPKGLPAEGDEGLDNTPTWGRTYWGGALFCLIADVRLREATANRHGLQTAMRAIDVASRGNVARWPIERVMSVADESTGTSVVSTLYREWGSAPVAVDLAALFARLGVSASSTSVSFDDSAPLAAIRRAITAA